MFFVKYFRKKRNIDLNRFWEKERGYLKGKDLCKARGHDWQALEDEHIGKCKRCGEFAVK